MYRYNCAGVCARSVDFDIKDDGTLTNVSFMGGCAGNLLAIGKLVEGKDAAEIAEILKGNRCGGKPTSCGDQLAKGIEAALAQRNA
ncbi:MAG: TIGR03905 family TSCPD domain-containing protein [Coriobacteriia bacterium]|nr:TIGR03905 family TSCPD domain-containing protein [Coriobacteriia bacterium]